MFVATFRVRPPWLDFALAGAAVALIVASAARSRRLWSLAAAVSPGGSRAAWRACAAFTAGALLVLIIAGALLKPPQQPWPERFLNWHFALAVALYFPWALLQQYIFQFYWHGRWLRLVPAQAALVLTALAFAAVHFGAIATIVGASCCRSRRRTRCSAPRCTTGCSAATCSRPGLHVDASCRAAIAVI